MAAAVNYPSEMAFADDLSAEEQAALELAGELVATGNLHPLIARLRDGELGPESARDALRIVAELDLDLLLQITLDSLVTTYLDDPELAHQPRRVVRGASVPD